MIFALREENKTYTSVERELQTVRLHIDINTICNQKCEYCYARQEKHSWGLIISNKYIDEILLPNLKKIAEDTYLDVILLGGEPTLHPRFNEVLSFILSLKNTRVSITSNGTNAYNDNKCSERVRWAFTYHPSQVKDITTWINPLLQRKNDWWEVAISPLIDCWGSKRDVIEKAKRVKEVITLCRKNDIKVQPTFQFNPYEDGEAHIDMKLVEQYYSFLEEEYPIYVYGDEYLNDYTILKNKKNYLQGCMCVNNNFSLSVKGELRQTCTNKDMKWEDLVKENKLIICPMKECTCYGFLSLHKEL